MGCPNTSNFVKSTPLRIGVRARGAGGAAAAPKFGQVSFVGQQEKFFKTFLKRFHLFREIAMSLKTEI